MQQRLWITLWRVCEKRRQTCVQQLWIMVCSQPMHNFFLQFDRAFLCERPVDRDVIEVVLEGWRGSRRLCTIRAILQIDRVRNLNVLRERAKVLDMLEITDYGRRSRHPQTRFARNARLRHGR